MELRNINIKETTIDFFEKFLSSKSYNTISISTDEKIISLSKRSGNIWKDDVSIVSELINRNMNKGYKIYFWSRTPIYLTVGKVTMYKGIRSEQSLEWIPKTDVYTNFTKINNGGFFSVVMELKDSQLKDAMDYIRGGNLNYIYDAVGYLFASKNRSLDYSSIDNFLSKNFCNNSFHKCHHYFYINDFILIQPFGQFDDRDFDVAIIGNKKLIDEAFDINYLLRN